MANTLFKEVINEVGKDIFKSIHDKMGFDFCKEFEIVKIEGRFTPSVPFKEVGYDRKHSRAVCLTKFSSVRKYYKTYVIDKDGVDNISFSAQNAWSCYTKTEAKECMDSYSGLSYIILQKDSQRTFKKQRQAVPNIHDRYKVTDSWTGCSGEYYHLDLFCDGKTYSEGANAKSIDEIIDKSGYLVQLSRKALAGRVKDLKAKRLKDAYKLTNNVAEIDKMIEQTLAIKNALCTALMVARTSDEMRKVLDKLSGWHSVRSILEDLERIREREQKKMFDSIESFNSEMKYMQKQIAELVA